MTCDASANGGVTVMKLKVIERGDSIDGAPQGQGQASFAPGDDEGATARQG